MTPEPAFEPSITNWTDPTGVAPESLVTVAVRVIAVLTTGALFEAVSVVVVLVDDVPLLKALTKLAASIDPQPLARSYPVVAE